MKFEMTFTPLSGVEIPASATLEELVDRCGFSNKFPPVKTWGYQVMNRGPRPLSLAQFSRDMAWEAEVDDVYQDLLGRQLEFALIEDLLAAYLHPMHYRTVSDGTVRCLGSPVVGDLEPLYQWIYEERLHFATYEGWGSKESRILVAEFQGTPTPRSRHFPFSKTPLPNGIPTPSELVKRR